ncbi:hypothetical protein AB4097_17665 [Microvirga sp. 2MCAF35]|uniref:hypothetical protein n=1 Tax=Microvirga sp. 2MCAF35 TaxID=3232987 RepID=UPI003F9D694D
MPRPNSLPQQAVDHIPAHAQGNLPGFLQPYHYATSASDEMVGKAGVVDYFIFDTLKFNTSSNSVDVIYGFEAGVDQVIVTRAAQDVTEEINKIAGTKVNYGSPDPDWGYILWNQSESNSLYNQVVFADLPVGPVLTVAHYSGDFVI